MRCRPYCRWRYGARFFFSGSLNWANRRFLRRFAGIGYFAVLTVAVYAVTYGLTGGRSVYPFQQVYLYDLSALSIERGQPLFPEYIRNDENFSLERVAARYNERSAADLIFPDVPNAGDRPVLKLTEDAGQVAELKQAWIGAIKQDPAGLFETQGTRFRPAYGARKGGNRALLGAGIF